MDAIDFTGKSAAVTGAAKGIGAAVVEVLAQSGAHVHCLDIDERALGEQVATWSAQGFAVEAHPTDLQSSASVDATFRAIASSSPTLDILANVAGVVRYGKLDEVPEEDWDFILDTNLKGAYLTIRRAVPLMRAAGRGSIVNVGSVQALASQATVAAYSASKGGLISLTRTVALDYAAEGIRCNCVLPGSVETPMLRQGADLFFPDNPLEAMQGWGAAHPLGFLTQPVDIANVITFLCSDYARVVTGAAVVADAGLSSRLAV
jgi:NAD(P)-dependent dehydrogenase (short-subunit alcohol dehydrogenase family)